MLVAGCAAPRGAGDEPSRPGTQGERAAATSRGVDPGLDPEVVSLLGRRLYARAAGADPQQERQLVEAQAALAERPEEVERVVWVGRRLGYLWRMNEAIAAFSRGLARHPGYAPLYRHRAHRYVSLRRFDDAICDLRRAAELIEGRPDEIEPDGMPNARNVPLTTLAFNVWYHLGLAHYLKGEWEAALAAYERTMGFSRRYDDNLVATTYWTYLTLRRLSRDQQAGRLLEPIHADMDIIENRAYHRLLLLYKGVLPVQELLEAQGHGTLDDATAGYGIGMWYWLRGDREQARRVFERVVESEYWPAFGFIAAEAELARMPARESR